MHEEQLAQYFGPKLLMAITLIIKDEVNILRKKVNLSERTNDQLLTAIKNRLDNTEDYQWQKNFNE